MMVLSDYRRCIRMILFIILLLAMASASGFALEITLYTMPGYEATMTAIVHGWQDANPQFKEVDVKLVAGWTAPLYVMTAGGTPPDIIFYSSSQVPEFAYNGLLMDLGKLVAGEPEVIRGFIGSTLDVQKYRGVLFGLPHTWSAVATLYNARLLSEQGVAVPNDNWTWESLVQIGRKLTRDTNGDGNINQFAFAESAFSAHRWPVWLFGAGADLYNDNLTESKLDEPQAIKAINFDISLYRDYHIAPKVVGGKLVEPGLNGSANFTDGNMVFYNSTRYSLPVENRDSYGVLPLPLGPVARTSIMVANFFAIHPNTKYLDIAWSLVKFAVSAENWKVVDPNAGGLPALTKQTLQVLRSATERNALNWVTVAEDSIRPNIYHPALGQIKINWDAMVEGTAPVADVLVGAVKVHNAALKEAWARKPW